MARPMETFDQGVIAAKLEITPTPAVRRTIHDLSGAALNVVRFEHRTDELTFDFDAVVDHRPDLGADPQDDDAGLTDFSFRYADGDAAALALSITPLQADAEGLVDAWARRFLRPVGQTRLATILSDMTRAMREDISYEIRLEGRPQSAAQTLALSKGSCRDFAVLMIEALRRLGVAAQFVSGYIYGGSARAGSHAGGGHTHAWVRAYLPGCGWCDYDPTNGLVGAANLIRMVTVADPRDALPLHGTWAGLRSDFLGMDVSVDIGAQGGETMQPIDRERIWQRRS